MTVTTAAVRGGAEVTMAVAHVRAVEVVEVIGGRMIAPMLREAAMIAVARVEVTVDAAVETAGAVKPGACTDEDAAVKPLWAVIPVWCAIVGGEVIVPVGAFWRGADVDADGNLGVCFWGWH